MDSKTLTARLADIERRVTKIERFLEIISGSARQPGDRVELPPGINTLMRQLRQRAEPASSREECS